jgi:hypothetical protein
MLISANIIWQNFIVLDQLRIADSKQALKTEEAGAEGVLLAAVNPARFP